MATELHFSLLANGKRAAFRSFAICQKKEMRLCEGAFL